MNSNWELLNAESNDEGMISTFSEIVEYWIE